MKKIKVLIVDDSALIRQILTEILSADEEIDVVGSASNPLIARDKIKQLNPDVLTLDVEMPKMDGMTFLANVMRLRPMPVVMISSLTAKGADITLQALELGAVDFMLKPKVDALRSLDEYGELITLKVKIASKANVRRQTVAPVRERSEPSSQGAPVLRHFKVTNKIIAIGASTGGTEAIQEVLLGLPADLPGIVITQHIPEQFSERFAIRMNSCCALTVSEARHGDQILPGHVYIAPGDQHLSIERSGTKYICLLNGDSPVNRHRPSVDVLFHSVAKHARGSAVGVILTGMGNDGAAGLKAMRDAGATTVAQDENTSVVWGMPGEAVKLGAAEKIVPLEQVAGTIHKLVLRK